MALATTCPQCKTSFKVVPDQLKLRRGLVRCGVCQHVFSGVEHLRYVDKDESTERIPAPGAPETAPKPAQGPVSRPGQGALAGADLRAMAGDDGLPAGAFAPARSGQGGVPATGDAAFSRPGPDDDDALKTRFFMSDGDTGTQNDDVHLPESLRQRDVAVIPDDEDPDTIAAGKVVNEANKVWRQQKPHAEAAEAGQQGRKRRRRRRNSADGSGASPFAWLQRLMASGYHRWIAILLVFVALVQIVSIFRDEIVAEVPALRPVVDAAATLTGQTIQPPMRLSSLSIESFELRATQQPNRTRMTAILRNRATVATRWPAMELTLTGPSNAVLVRKVLLPAQYLPSMVDQNAGMPANSEQPLDLLLETDQVNLAGYSVSLFYP